ncbi:VanZ family protein [Thauera sinica]|uniref:VanZ family protein n=1 Tax=Thauera sinica TaxID=2665146 RepID=A0ABW1ALY3_9RHOO|nr:VanZ family protein [Thauera sp. K11]ATE60911.1 heparinase [Thauera sp. K11]
MSTNPHQPASRAWQHARLAIAWAVFVTYGSLVPLEFRPNPNAWQQFLHTPWLQLGVGSRADWVANILLYVVLAYFAAGAVWTLRAARGLRIVLLGVVLGACLALAAGIEFLQLFFPPRTVSLNDLLAEGIGTMLGAGLWFVSGRRVAAMWERFTAGGTHSIRALLALYALGYLGLSFFPYDFLVSSGELAAKLARPDSFGIGPGLSCGSGFTCSVKLLVEALLVVPFGLLLVLARAGRGGVRAMAPVWGLAAGAALGLVVEAVQIVLASGTTQLVSVLTRALGGAWGVMLAGSHPRRWLDYSPAAARRVILMLLPVHIGLALALNGLLPLQLQPEWAALEKLDGLRFLPFYYHYYTSETAAVRSLLFVAGSYAPVGVAAAIGWPATPRRAAIGAVLFTLVLCFAIELLKLFSVGTRPDPTNLLIAAASAWGLHWVVRRLLAHGAAWVEAPGQAATRPAPPAARGATAWRPVLLGAVLPVAALFAVVATTVPSAPPAGPLDGAAATYPPPSAIPPVDLPEFRFARPRLPHPSPGDIALLQARNPGYLGQIANIARTNPGAVDAAILAAAVKPYSVDLARTHEKLMALRFWERGHAQVKPLALAYDWLYDQWTVPERESLRDKLAEGCDYVIDVIRKEQLSPYNVYLYNAPLQALMACAIALYRDHPRGGAYMTFTHELWKNRVLPVWRQVFGRNGGWHEGGEYVAIGIGQAIYTLPAMWRAATGEDLFDTEPGIRGFLDFLVHRTRPDGTQYRWGDGSHFLRQPPDAVPLALEYRHAAAYALAPPQRGPVPTGWPWGPLSDASPIDPHAAGALPPARLFDGIGMLVARSDWSPDATYVSFKAGDNFWSHSHLDQGAFTIYKGGELAIDSGLYGPAYGSDHHMNYTYQSIAHNLVTVTDPGDVMPGPGFDAGNPRHYANDGGQRRIGSGWGVEAAPLDLAEWQKRRDTYHTGRIVQHLDEDDLVVAVADLTPAYTNSQSGRGTFAHRTKRVERLWRVFGYDRANDAIVVFDDVVATDAAFRKRWLLHAIEPPLAGADTFSLFIAASAQPGHGGGQLLGHVLLPRKPLLNVIGGPGFEFFVDGKNYDDGGRVREAMQKTGPGRPEPGSWRIELMPPSEAKEDQFLVVMLPTLAGHTPQAVVHRLEDGGRVGAEVIGPQRTTRWWYRPGTQGVEIEVVGSDGARRHLLAPR